MRSSSVRRVTGLVDRGAVKKTVTGVVKKYKGVSAALLVLQAEMEELRREWSQRTISAAMAA
jgi:hypothetical protein